MTRRCNKFTNSLRLCQLRSGWFTLKHFIHALTISILLLLNNLIKKSFESKARERQLQATISTKLPRQIIKYLNKHVFNFFSTGKASPNTWIFSQILARISRSVGKSNERDDVTWVTCGFTGWYLIHAARSLWNIHISQQCTVVTHTHSHSHVPQRAWETPLYRTAVT